MQTKSRHNIVVIFATFYLNKTAKGAKLGKNGQKNARFFVVSRVFSQTQRRLRLTKYP